MAKRPTRAEIIAQLPAARARAARAELTEPHARAAHYDPATGCLVVALTNGASFTLPAASLPGLEGATAAQLATVEVGPVGIALTWPALDADLSVAGLARLVFGGHTLAQAAGAQGGRVRSAAKAEAARANGAKGGRPRTDRAATPRPATPRSKRSAKPR